VTVSLVDPSCNTANRGNAASKAIADACKEDVAVLVIAGEYPIPGGTREPVRRQLITGRHRGENGNLVAGVGAVANPV
jgi:hypothetical protein